MTIVLGLVVWFAVSVVFVAGFVLGASVADREHEMEG